MKVVLGKKYRWTRHPEIEGVASAKVEYLEHL